MLFSLGFHPQALFLKHNLWTSNSKNTTVLFVQQLYIPKTIEMTQEKSFKGKICIYVRKYGRFPLKVEKLNSFYKPWCMSETPGHSRTSPGQSLVGSLLLSPGSRCAQGFVYALQKSVSRAL